MTGSEQTRALTLLAAAGDAVAAEELLPLVYAELRRIAKSHLDRFGGAGRTLQATALVHEAYVKLIGAEDPGWNGKAHFFAAAARAMRNILVDQARRRGSIKRGGDRERVSLEEAEIAVDEPREDIIALDAALKKLEEHDRGLADLVMLRYFSGLTEPEAAVALNMSERTVRRDWQYARAWLREQIVKSSEGG
jgi:RNA polymerase sigma factor (TIGR02999 family)